MKIAVSAYFNPDNDSTWLARPHNLPAIYAGVLNHAGIDILFVQDGAGSHYPVDDTAGMRQYRELVREYFRGFNSACQSVNPPVQLWALLEIFRYDSTQDEYDVASYSRFLDQVGTVHSVLPTAPFVLFDFYHFMNPARSGTHERGVPGENSLYEMYRTEYLHNRR